MNKHTFWMIVGCAEPLLLIFLLPLFGVQGNFSFLIFVIGMFACHIMMMGMHDNRQPSDNSKIKDKKNESHQH